MDTLHQPKKKKVLENPKSCSFNIQIREVACGEDFAFLLTKKGLLYAMGSNQFGKLGILSSQNLKSG
jgi:alpha-tubulin suppressor-like RCC1 family protein